MFFSNLQVYRLPSPWSMTAEQLADKLAAFAFAPASSNELMRQGWDKPRPNGGLVHVVNKQMLMVLGTEKKLLPSTVVNQVAKARAAEMEEQQGFAPGKKAMKELKERVHDELLPRAFTIRSNTWCWIDPVNGWLVVDAASPAKADDVIKHLLKAVDRMPVESLRVARSPAAMMTEWLNDDESPAHFTIDMDADLERTGETKAKVKFVKHTLEPDEVRRHIAAGKQVTKLAMTWDSKISFVLTESLAIKSVKPLDIMKENDAVTRNDDERFDGDFMLMTAELARLLDDLMDALGGEAADLVSPARERAPKLALAPTPIEQAANERAVRLTAQLYQTRDDAKQLLGDGYAARMKRMGEIVQEEMATSGGSAIEAAMAVCKRQASTGNNMFIMAAAVELVEPSAEASPA